MRQPPPIHGHLAAAGVSLLLATLVALLLATTAAAAPGARLLKARVTPASGTTATLFTFSVDFQGNGETAVEVTAMVANSLVPLARGSGSDAKGSWRGASKLPAGSWPVTFRALSSGAGNPTLAGPTVVVAGAPTPTPRPAPTARPTATPGPTPPPDIRTAAPVPTSAATPEPTQTPFGVAVADPSNPGGGTVAVATGSGAPTPSPPGAAGTSTEPFRMPVEGVVAIGLLGAVAVVAASAERRRRQATADPGAAATSEAAEPPLDEDTIGTIEYAPRHEDLGEHDPGADPGEPPAELPRDEPPS